MNKLINDIADCLVEADNFRAAEILKSIATEFVNVKEAFHLGRALQKLFELETETSNSGFSETEILDVIRYVEQNMEQANY